MSRLLSPELLYALQGRFICVDGIDGSGKTTLLANLKAELEKSAVLPDGSPFLYRFVREPGTTPLGEKLREILLDKTITCSPMTQALLFTAARAELTRVLHDSEATFCDRWVSSTYAYQGQEIGSAAVRDLHDLSISRDPDLVVILDLSVVTAAARLKASGKSADRFESKPDEFFENASDGFRSYAYREYDTELLDAGCSQEELLSKFIDVLHDSFL